MWKAVSDNPHCFAGLRAVRTGTKTMMALLMSLVLCVAVSSRLALGDIKVEDLSHVQKPGLPTYPIYPDLNFTIGHRGFFRKSLWLEYNIFATVEHYGTHVDAPSHLGKGQWRLHQVPLAQFMGPAVVVDVREKAVKYADAQVTVKDLQDWEAKYGKIPDGAMVLMLSGWAAKFKDENAFLGSNTVTDDTSFHFPGFHPDSVRWLVKERPNFHGIGVDTISLDYGPSFDLTAHQILFKANKIGYENLNNLNKLPMSGAMFYGAPMNLFDGSGCPVRAFATYDSNSASNKLPRTAAVFSLILTGIYIIHILG